MSLMHIPVQPYVNPPYRQKIVEGGGFREHDDWKSVMVHCQNNGSHLLAHPQGECVQYLGDESSQGSIVIEIHEGWNKDFTSELEECKMTSFTLGPEERKSLALYLLSTL